VDGLYEFTRAGSFQEHLVAFLEHALLPLREYVCHFYPRRSSHTQPVIPDDKTYPYLRITKSPKYDISTSNSFGLKPMLEGLSRKGKVQCVNVFEVSIELVVPPNREHEFWSRRELRREDGVYQNGISINVNAIGTSENDARENAMLRLKAFLDACHEQMWPSLSSQHRNFSKNPPVNFKDDAALQMARELLEIYRRVKSHISNWKRQSRISGWKRQRDAWEEVSQTLERYLKEKTDVDLRPLINYYLVCNLFLHHLYPFWFYSLMSIKGSVRLHQKRPSDAIGHLIACQNDTVSPTFRLLVDRRLEEACETTG
jgi:hypothetical protein